MKVESIAAAPQDYRIVPVVSDLIDAALASCYLLNDGKIVIEASRADIDKMFEAIGADEEYRGPKPRSFTWSFNSACNVLTLTSIDPAVTGLEIVRSDLYYVVVDEAKKSIETFETILKMPFPSMKEFLKYLSRMTFIFTSDRKVFYEHTHHRNKKASPVTLET